MYALEPEPERRGRYGRMGVGLAIAGAAGVAVVFAAQHLEPAQRFLPEILRMTVVSEDVPQKPPDLPPLPPEPPKPKAEPKVAQQRPAAPQLKAPKQADQPAPEQIGLDPSSFGSGSGGPGFAAGSSQMGRVGTPVAAPKPVIKPTLARAREGNPMPGYTYEARKARVEGLMVLEVHIDAQGRVTRARVRGGLDQALDDMARKAVERWRFEPATLDGQAIASTQFVRIRFDLN